MEASAGSFLFAEMKGDDDPGGRAELRFFEYRSLRNRFQIDNQSTESPHLHHHSIHRWHSWAIRRMCPRRYAREAATGVEVEMGALVVTMQVMVVKGVAVVAAIPVAEL